MVASPSRAGTLLLVQLERVLEFLLRSRILPLSAVQIAQQQMNPNRTRSDGDGLRKSDHSHSLVGSDRPIQNVGASISGCNGFLAE